jgi:hypothetical protein
VNIDWLNACEPIYATAILDRDKAALATPSGGGAGFAGAAVLNNGR